MEQMDLLQKNCRLQCLDVQKEIECMMMMVNDLLMEHLELLKQDKMDHLDCLEREMRWLVVPVYHQLAARNIHQPLDQPRSPNPYR